MLDLPELERRVRALRLPDGSYAVFGSGPLLAQGLVEAVGDVDIVAVGPAWARARELGEPAIAAGGDPVVRLPGGVEIFGGWLGDDPSGIVERAERIGGLPYGSLEDVLAFKRKLNRPKDAAHIRALERHLGR